MLEDGKEVSGPTPAPPGTPVLPDSTPSARVSSTGRSYDLQERRRTGNMTGAEQAKYERIATDESEAQTLTNVDLDGIKSESCVGSWVSPLLCSSAYKWDNQHIT